MARRFGRKPTPMKPLSQEQVNEEIAALEAKSAERHAREEADINEVRGSEQILGEVGKEHEMGTGMVEKIREEEDKQNKAVNYHFTRRAHRYYGRGTLLGQNARHGQREHWWVRTEDGQDWLLGPGEFTEL